MLLNTIQHYKIPMSDRIILTVSIDRQSGKWAVFAGGWTIIKKFESYETEEGAAASARAWIEANHPGAEIKTVYPQITSMRVTHEKRK